MFLWITRLEYDEHTNCDIMRVFRILARQWSKHLLHLDLSRRYTLVPKRTTPGQRTLLSCRQDERKSRTVATESGLLAILSLQRNTLKNKKKDLIDWYTDIRFIRGFILSYDFKFEIFWNSHDSIGLTHFVKTSLSSPCTSLYNLHRIWPNSETMHLTIRKRARVVQEGSESWLFTYRYRQRDQDV